MKGERKLRLVTGGGDPAPSVTSHLDEPPITDEELAEAAARRDRIDRGEDDLVIALKAAHAPGPLAEPDLDAILARAFGEEEEAAPGEAEQNRFAATAAERAASERLRAALSGEAPMTEDAEILIALKLAAKPTEISPAKNEELIAAAFHRVFRKGSPVRRIAPVTMAALATVTALAAGVALFIGQKPVAPDATTAALVPARSAQELFDPASPFPRRGGESARVDRIATARAADLRQNRFTSWGVR